MTEKKDRTNAEKSYTLAKALFPDEEWIPTFIRLLSDLPIESVKSKIAGELNFVLTKVSSYAFLRKEVNYSNGHTKN